MSNDFKTTHQRLEKTDVFSIEYTQRTRVKRFQDIYEIEIWFALIGHPLFIFVDLHSLNTNTQMSIYFFSK